MIKKIITALAAITSVVHVVLKKNKKVEHAGVSTLDTQKEIDADAKKSSSTDKVVEKANVQKKCANNMNSKTRAEVDNSKTKENVINSEPTLNASQKTELGDKILKIIAGISSAGSWCQFTNVATNLSANGISYKDFGFPKLSLFLNEFADYFDFRQTPSPKEGAAPNSELRIKAHFVQLIQNSNSSSFSANSINADENHSYAGLHPQKQKNLQISMSDFIHPRVEKKITPMKSAASFLFGKEGSATEKLMAFAIFPNSNNDGFFGNIEKLSQIALEETWGFGDDAGHKYPILKSYFIYTFERLVYEDEKNKYNPNWKTKIRLSNDGKYALFNTGLVDQYFEPIFALFLKNKISGITSEWVFLDFPNSKDNSMGTVYKYFGKDRDLPEPANYLEHNNNSELIYNLDYPISKSNNWEHIIAENCDRLPVELLKNSGLPFDFSRFVDTSINKERRHEELMEVLKNSPESCRRIKFAIENAIGLALKRVRWNFKTAIPIYYPRFHKICLLLPLCLCDEKKADAALVLDSVNGIYIQRTIFTLKMAYNDARLITRPDSDWLETSKIDPTQEEN